MRHNTRSAYVSCSICPVPVWSVPLTYCKFSGKPCWHTELCTRNVSRPIMHLVCIDWTLSAYCTQGLQHGAAAESGSDAGSGGRWMSWVSSAFFSLTLLQRRARFWTLNCETERACDVHIQILCTQPCISVHICICLYLHLWTFSYAWCVCVGDANTRLLEHAVSSVLQQLQCSQVWASALCVCIPDRYNCGSSSHQHSHTAHGIQVFSTSNICLVGVLC